MHLLDIYKILKSHYLEPPSWPNWDWPLSGRFAPPEWEVCVGAILTQNTNWSNVEKAINNLVSAGIVTPEKTLKIRMDRLKAIIKPAGFYNQKAPRLKALADFVLSKEEATREKLLAIKGVGPETADSTILYAFDKPSFVIDAYTRRIFSRLGLITGKEPYESLRSFFEKELAQDTKLYKQFHALIVEHAKQTCKKEPLCESCPLLKVCVYGKERS